MGFSCGRDVQSASVSELFSVEMKSAHAAMAKEAAIADRAALAAKRAKDAQDKQEQHLQAAMQRKREREQQQRVEEEERRRRQQGQGAEDGLPADENWDEVEERGADVATHPRADGQERDVVIAGTRGDERAGVDSVRPTGGIDAMPKGQGQGQGTAFVRKESPRRVRSPPLVTDATPRTPTNTRRQSRSVLTPGGAPSPGPPTLPKATERGGSGRPDDSLVSFDDNQGSRRKGNRKSVVNQGQGQGQGECEIS